MNNRYETTVELINHIRWSLSLGETLDSIVAELTDDGVTSDRIFLAYHAAIIIESDYV